MDPLVIVPIAVVFGVCMILGRNELVKRRLVCPGTGTVAEVDVVQRYRKRRPVRVKSCDHLSDPKVVDCGQECLRHEAWSPDVRSARA